MTSEHKEAAHGAYPPGKPWMDASKTPTQRADLLLGRMTTAEKLELVHGVVEGTLEIPPVDYTGYVAGNKKLGIPPLNLEDGPGGIGDAMQDVTDFPVPLALAATWSPALAKSFGVAVGQEARTKGVGVLLGPTINIARDPRWGRNFETFGEDPLLTSAMGDAVIRGVQSQGVIATAKHFAAYGEETDRMTGSVMVSQRALHEVYLPPFESAVAQAHVGAVMAAYNKLNGVYASQSSSLLSKTLLKAWRFSGFTVSDWHGTHSTVSSATAGLDMEMPGERYFGTPLASAVAGGKIPIAVLDRMVRGILVSMFRMGLFDRPASGDPFANAARPAHRSLAKSIEEKAIVLLKNRDNILPLAPVEVHTVAVVDVPVMIGGVPSEKVDGCGSAYVQPNGTVSVYAGIAARAARNGIKVTDFEGSDPAQAAASAASADLAVVVVHDDGCEDVIQRSAQGSNVADRPDLSLPGGQDAVIEAVARANPHTVVVLETQGAVAMPWLSEVQSVLEVWYGGEETGDALAAVLFGDVDPSGRLPETFPASQAQMPTAGASRFPGVDGVTDFSEGIDVGYRGYEAMREKPLFPFGYGLSYAHFSISDISVLGSVAAGSFDDGKDPTTLGSVKLAMKITDRSRRAGTDVLEVYIGDPRSTGEPSRQLVGLAQARLGPGKSSVVTVEVPARALAWWDSARSRWKISAGRYSLMVGSSSEAVLAARTLTVS